MRAGPVTRKNGGVGGKEEEERHTAVVRNRLEGGAGDGEEEGIRGEENGRKAYGVSTQGGGDADGDADGDGDADADGA